jgi:hypothetical protein
MVLVQSVVVGTCAVLCFIPPRTQAHLTPTSPPRLLVPGVLPSSPNRSPLIPPHPITTQHNTIHPHARITHPALRFRSFAHMAAQSPFPPGGGAT